ncbi:MAG TPA: hypothetical protein VN436_06255 [Holophaga sp.]|nr:hypothetical protein [Holophaga sp.]
MATNTNTAGFETPLSEVNLEGTLSEALELVGQHRCDQAAALLETLKTAAEAQGKVSMARTARVYLSAMQSRTEEKAKAECQPELDAQVLLNRGAVDEALKLLESALKAQEKDARLFYLKATAHALKDEAEASAQALRQAASLNKEFLHQYRLERDFDRVRTSAPFASFELE